MISVIVLKMHKMLWNPLILLNFHPGKKPQNLLFLVLNITNIVLQECANMTCTWCMTVIQWLVPYQIILCSVPWMGKGIMGHSLLTIKLRQWSSLSIARTMRQHRCSGGGFDLKRMISIMVKFLEQFEGYHQSLITNCQFNFLLWEDALARLI